jgi:hypothetical protein
VIGKAAKVRRPWGDRRLLEAMISRITR